MHTVLSILLYLLLIFSPGEYTTGYINDTVAQNQASYDAVYCDPVERNAAIEQYGDKVQYITVIDDMEDD